MPAGASPGASVPVSPPWLRLAVHAFLPLALWALFLTGSVLQVWAFLVDDWDYGIFANLFWNFSQRGDWFCSLYEGLRSSPNFLADHLALLVPVWAPFMRLAPSVYTLAVLHACAFGLTLGILPFAVREVFFAAGRREYLWPALFLELSLAVYKPFLAAWRYETHMDTLAMPLVLLAIIALHRRAWVWATCCCAVLLLSDERAALGVAGIGLYAALVCGAPRLGAWITLAGLGWFLAAVKIVIPWIAGGAYLYESSICLGCEVGVKLNFLQRLVSYLFFLPLAGPWALRASAAALPLVALSLVSGRGSMYRFSHHYSDMLSLLLVVAAAHGLVWLTSQPGIKRLPRWGIAAGAVLLLVFSWKQSWHSNPFNVLKDVRMATYAPALQGRVAAYAQVPTDCAVYAQTGIGPHFALRSRRYLVDENRAARPFEDSVVILSPAVGSFGMDYSKTVEALEANPSLRRLEATDILRVYASRDGACLDRAPEAR